MDATELRALADALEPMARAPRFEDMDVPAFCRWLRAQADAQPVAWLHDVVQDGDEPDQALSFYRDSFPLEGVGGFRSIGCVPLYLHPAPAVPAGWKLVPVEPTEAHLASMGMRHRHDYGMLDEKFQDSIRCQMRQLYEEAIGEGFFRIAAPAVPTGDYSANGEPLYTPPAAPAIEERGPWFAERDQQRAWVDSDDFTHDARLYVNGDFESNDQRFAYAQEVARRLNAAPAAPQAEPMTKATQDVLAERRRQIEVEGWTPEHDDGHVLGEIAALAAFYAVPDGVRDWDFSSTGYGDTLAEALLPNGWTVKAGEDRRRDLVKAGALILAEIERLDRMGGSDAE